MPSVRFAAAGTEAVPLVLFAMPDALEKVVIGSPPAVQVEFEQTWKVTVPVSFGSGSLNVAVSEGVAELSCAPLAGVTSAGVVGAASVVLLVMEGLVRVAVAAWLPAGLPVESVAVSRRVAPLPGLV